MIKKKKIKKCQKLSEKKKIEEIAKNFLKKQKSYKNINTMIEMNKDKIDNIKYKTNKDANINNGEETLKDSISLRKTQNQNNFENKENMQDKKSETIYNKYMNNEKMDKSNDNLKFYSTVNHSLTDYYYCCKKNTEIPNSQIEDNNNKNNININKNENNINNNELIVNNKQEKRLQNRNNEEYKNMDNQNIALLECNLETLIDENNLDAFNKIIIIYKELMIDFSNKNLREKKDHFKSQILSCDFFNFLFSDKIHYLLKYFNYNINVIKFILYQIYLFLSIINIDENKELNECSEMAYRTILLYSSQNYELLINIIKKIINPSEPKIYKSLISRNKIIISILKTLIPKKIRKNNYNLNNNDSNSLSKNNILSLNFLEEIENETKFKKGIEIENIIYKKAIQFLSNIKNNDYFKNKINHIEKKKIENIINNNCDNNINNKESSEEKYLKNENILPDFDDKKYKYSLFIELDETLVHYYEEGNNYFVKVRCGAEDFIKTMSGFCEIIIVSTSSKEYTDIIVKNINKDNNYINHTIYKELYDDEKFLDFSKINRDIKKCIFICHTDEFFNAPKNNIVKLSEFLGEETDREIVYLNLELMKLSVNYIDNVSTIIKDIMKFIKNKREEK